MPSVVGLIPMRSGSKRLPGKNIRILNGHPLASYSIAAAIDSGVFGTGMSANVYVSTDSNLYADIARKYGARVIMRPAQYSTDTSPDCEWVTHALTFLASGGLLDGLDYGQGAKDRAKRMGGTEYDCFAILRPTSPFRTADTIRRAWARWCEKGDRFDSMRAVEKCSQHPYKMWTYETSSSRVEALCDLDYFSDTWAVNGVPGHSRQYASLPTIYVQNASLEIAWTKTVWDTRSIAGQRVLPFFTEGHEGMDVNRPGDWDAVELILSKQEASLPQIPRWYKFPTITSEYYLDRGGNFSHLDKAGTGWCHANPVERGQPCPVCGKLGRE
jgi:CMP-N,N'-diacetyllegionaminic acid synthase